MKKSGWFRRLSLVVAAVMLILSFAGCSAKSGTSVPVGTSAPSGAGAPANTDKQANISLWIGLNAKLQQLVKTYEEVPFWQELQKKTNVKIKFIHPPVGQEKEQFNLMIASGDYPDIIGYSWSSYPGGAAKAIKDKVILPLNDLIEKDAPNFKKALAEYPNAKKYITTEEGSIYNMPTILTTPEQRVTQGPIVRKDWIDELGMKEPETIDDWYAMLTAFKTKKKASSPMVVTAANLKLTNCFAGAYGTAMELFEKDGAVKFGPIEPGFKDYLSTMRKWYSEGLIDPDFASLDKKTIDAKLTGGQAGVGFGPLKGGLGAWMAALQSKEPKAVMIGSRYPTLKPGDRVDIGQYNDEISGVGAAVTTKTTQKERCVSFLDYGYGDEGQLLFNFGIQGVSYEMVNGQPKYTDMIMKSSEPPINKLSMYAPSADGGTWQKLDVRFNNQMDDQPEMLVAKKNWSTSSTFTGNIPKAVTPAQEDSSKYASIMNEVNTYVDEMFLKFVMGQESLDKYDDFVKTIKNKKIDEALAIMQKSLDSFKKR